MAPLRQALLALAVAGAAQAASTGGSQKPITEKHGSSGSKNPLNEDFAKFVQEALDVWHVPGMSVGVIDGDDIYTEGYGYATLPDVRATADTLWYGASTSKAYTAALLSHLIHSGNHSEFPKGWETPISSIIRDDFVLQDEWATAHVTLNDAASHRSGMGRHDLGLQRERDGRQQTTRDVVRSMRNLAMLAEPRVKYSYCNLMYTTLGHVVEAVTGKWLGDSLREHIWKPLGMDATFFDLNDALGAKEHFAAGYAWNETAGNYTRIDYMVVTDVGGAGAVISNVKDYAKWVKALLHKSAPFSEKTHADIQTPRMLAGAESAGDMAMVAYGLGWGRSTLHQHTYFQHAGGMHAYGAEVYWLPQINFGVVSFGNTAGSSNFAQKDVIYRLIEDKLNIPAKDRTDIRAMNMEAVKEMVTREKALENFFPDRPKVPLASSFNISQLLGRYEDAGWGDVTFTEAKDPKDPSKSILVGPRPKSTFKGTMVAEHITGDYWLAQYLTEGESKFVEAFFSVRFVAGVDGQPATMEVDTAQGEGDAGDGVIVFTRVE